MTQRGSERRPAARGFTVVELLVVIAIIVVLISILVPVTSRIRSAARNASLKSFLAQLSGAIEAYEADFKAYPGPLTNLEVYNSSATLNPTFDALTTPPSLAGSTYVTADPNFRHQITMSENLVLGLLGGLQMDTTTTPGSPVLYYDPRLVGSGAFGLSTRGTNKQYKAYIESQNLSWRFSEDDEGAAIKGKKTGHFRDALSVAGAADSIIPEFVDNETDPLPILYLRAKRGASTGGVSAIDNTIVTYDETNSNNRVGQYDLHQIIGYTKSKIGAGHTAITPVGYNSPPQVHGLIATTSDPVNPSGTMTDPSPQPLLKYQYPYNAYPYFRNQTLSSPKEADPAMTNLTLARNDVPHQKDGFIIICAGPDRIYGTKDDITNFGEVGQ